MVATGERYRTIDSVPVTVWWELDTVAILDDYSESCVGELPVGEVIEVEDVQDNRIFCRAERERSLRDKLIPRKRQNRLLWFRLPTPYAVEIQRKEFGSRIEGPLTNRCS